MKPAIMMFLALLSALVLTRAGGLRRLQDQEGSEIDPDYWEAADPMYEYEDYPQYVPPFSLDEEPNIEDVPIEEAEEFQDLDSPSIPAPEYEQNQYEAKGVEIDSPAFFEIKRQMNQPAYYEPYPLEDEFYSAAKEFIMHYGDSSEYAYYETDPLTGYEFYPPERGSYYENTYPYKEYYETSLPRKSPGYYPIEDVFHPTNDPDYMLNGEFYLNDYEIYPVDIGSYYPNDQFYETDPFSEPPVDYEHYMRENGYEVDEDYFPEYDPFVEPPEGIENDQYDPFVEPPAEQGYGSVDPYQTQPKTTDYNLAAAEIDSYAKGNPIPRPVSNFRFSSKP